MRVLSLPAILLMACAPARSFTSTDASTSPDLAARDCVGRACDISPCPDGTDTIVTGRVLAPNGDDPVPGARIYVPATDVASFSSTVACDVCGPIPGAVAQARSAPDGTFTLAGVPQGLDVPIVIELGRFRRVITAPVTACITTPLPRDANTDGQRLPSRDTERSPLDHVPRIAVATGDYDQVECILKRMGLEQIDLYDDRGGLGGPTTLPSTIGTFAQLLSDADKLESYDLLIVNCTDAQFEDALLVPNVLANIERYVARGGRLYATDWAYDVIHQVPEFAPFLCFVPGGVGNSSSSTCAATPSAPRTAHSRIPYSTAATVERTDLANWLENFPSTISQMREIAVSFAYVVIAAAGDATHAVTTWLTGPVDDTRRPFTVTFDYKQCGRVHYSTFNTEPSGTVEPDTVETRYPMCGNRSTFFAQERVLEYLLFEISECVPQVP